MDYDPVTSQLPFLPGESRKEVVISITDELLPEENEIFQLSLSLVGEDRVVLRTTEANVTILDNDSELHIIYLINPYVALLPDCSRNGLAKHF